MKKIIAISLLTALSGIAVASAQPGEAREARRDGRHGARAAQHFQKLDTNGDKVVSRDELLSRITERFDRADADKNGTVTPEERKLAKQKWAEERFSKADANKDGALSADELPGRFAKKLQKLDANQDGKLTREELAVLKAKYEQHMAKRGGDQPKTRAELVAKVGERFSKMDTNQDGQLNIDELKSGQRGRHGKRGFGRPQQG
jgi:EF-hand domain pair/EF hand